MKTSRLAVKVLFRMRALLGLQGWQTLTVGLLACGFQVDEALFNFVNAWSLMFWPVMLADPRGQGVKNRLAYWVGTLVSCLVWAAGSAD